MKPNDFLKMELPELEAYLEKALELAEASDWDITLAFEKELRALTSLAKAKGSKRRW